MSISNLLDPNTGNEVWKQLYVNNVNTTNLTVTNSTSFEGNLTIQNDNPKVSVLNNAVNTNRAQLILNGKSPTLGSLVVQQTETGSAIVENFNNNSDISILPHGNGNVVLSPPTGHVKLSGTNYPSVSSVLSLDTSNNIITSSTFQSSGISLLAGGSQTGINTDIHEIIYTKHGNIVFFSVNIRVISLSGPANQPLTIDGLPYVYSQSTPIVTKIDCIWGDVKFDTGYAYVGGLINSSFGTSIQLYQSSGDETKDYIPLKGFPNLTTASKFVLSGFYFTDE
jgi:hypothetical protein